MSSRYEGTQLRVSPVSWFDVFHIHTSQKHLHVLGVFFLLVHLNFVCAEGSSCVVGCLLRCLWSEGVFGVKLPCSSKWNLGCARHNNFENKPAMSEDSSNQPRTTVMCWTKLLVWAEHLRVA